jgi:glucosamine--fructose-6-phosphate aminotransferase (isomerizing)
MCGIVGGVAERNIVPILLEGLKRLEYRGYDSSGIAVLDSDGQIQRVRALGKIQQLRDKIEHTGGEFGGQIGIAHTRWATHGVPSENNAHPHICNNQVAVVHNGIIENYQQLKAQQLQQGYRFTSETDTEVVAHCVHKQLQTAPTLLAAVQQAVRHFEGAYALGVVTLSDPDTLVAARKGSPLVIGVGIGEHFIASDVSALLPVTQSFIFLEEGDIAQITRESVQIFDASGQPVERPVKQSNLSAHAVELGEHRHYMHKEIFEQPQAVIDTLEGRITQDHVLVSAFGHQAETIFKSVSQVQIIACGTSYHSGLVAKYWFEDIIGLPCQVEVASEYRYRNPVIQDNTLFVTISQSGETADTLAALQQVKRYRNQTAEITRSSRVMTGEESRIMTGEEAEISGSLISSSGDVTSSSSHVTPSSSNPLTSSSGLTGGSRADSNITSTLYANPQGLNIPTLTICNVPESSLTRESDLTFLTHAGPEIGVASTKAFTTQLVALSLLLTAVGKSLNRMSAEQERKIVHGLQKLPGLITKALENEDKIIEIAQCFADRDSALFLGRGTMYPIALEGALKLKESSYIHAEAYPAGELKHGPLALIDEHIPVVTIAPHDDLLEKLKSNLQEVKARGGQMIVFEDEQSNISSEPGFRVIKATTNVGRITAPITFNIPLQLLSYHVALIKGTDVDQPRNLAKSVTVE